MSYVGGPGYELYVPVEMARHVYLALKEAGADLGLQDAGYYASTRCASRPAAAPGAPSSGPTKRPSKPA